MAASGFRCAISFLFRCLADCSDCPLDELWFVVVSCVYRCIDLMSHHTMCHTYASYLSPALDGASSYEWQRELRPRLQVVAQMSCHSGLVKILDMNHLEAPELRLFASLHPVSAWVVPRGQESPTLIHCTRHLSTRRRARRASSRSCQASALCSCRRPQHSRMRRRASESIHPDILYIVRGHAEDLEDSGLGQTRRLTGARHGRVRQTHRSPRRWLVPSCLRPGRGRRIWIDVSYCRAARSAQGALVGRKFCP
jgi:hypothetical protein